MKIAVIPARGGSKRLPGKNIATLNGKPLICWSIHAAIESQAFDEIIVSTDCPQIARVAQDAGAKVPFMRPVHLAGDAASTNSVVTHLVEWYEGNSRVKVESVAVLQPTSPLRNALHIQEAVSLIERPSIAGVVSICELEHPRELSNQLNPNGSMKGFISSGNVKRAQELSQCYRLNGAIYLFDREFVGSMEKLYQDDRVVPYIMDRGSSIDIDTQLDFDMANFFMKRLPANND